ncbi:hypothetical protein Vadar_034682 [Vaccinium darrowii]|uniref:Uncharacterized protein n=1 Tax=Vaccinium darrowii TaxID=229202 RepID=A0ACB7XVG9_9ERIC|nr:hypothetical protein Vadar_034682 [Vaccinium darrowii]
MLIRCRFLLLAVSLPLLALVSVALHPSKYKKGKQKEDGLNSSCNACSAFSCTKPRDRRILEWLLLEFADYHGVSDSYRKLRYLSYVMKVATPTEGLLEADEFVSNNTEGFLMDSITIMTGYLKMKNLCTNLCNGIQAHIKIHNQHILPRKTMIATKIFQSLINEGNMRSKFILGELYTGGLEVFLLHGLRLAPFDRDAEFQSSLQSWSVSPMHGGVEMRNLYHSYWFGYRIRNSAYLIFARQTRCHGLAYLLIHSTSPFVEEMYEQIKEMLIEYEVVMNRWPQYSLILENVSSHVISFHL